MGKEHPGCAIVPVRTVKQFGFPDFHYKIIDEPGLDYPNAIVTVKDRYLPVVAQNFLEYCLPTVAALQAEAAASSGRKRSCIPRGIQLLFFRIADPVYFRLLLRQIFIFSASWISSSRKSG